MERAVMSDPLMRWRTCGVVSAVTVLGFLGGALQASGQATTAAERRASWEQHVAMERASPFKDLRWRSLGPVKQGGRVECITRAGTTGALWVGAGAGNLWRSDNNGLTWTPVFEHESTFSIGDVQVDPSDPDVAWVGTGEVLMARSSYAGTGVFKTTDGGASWTHMGLSDSHHIARVLIHPKDPDVVWVAAIGRLYTRNQQRGVFRTRDGGKSWERVLFVDDRTGAMDVVMDPRDQDVLYATTWQHERRPWGHEAYGPGCGVWKSEDGGDTWRRLSQGLPTGDDVGRMGIAIAPTDPSVVYVVLDHRDDAREGVYRSDDAGASFRRVNEDRIRAGYDFCIVEVAPDNPDEVWVPGQTTWRSTDGGKKWTQVKGTLIHLLEHDSSVLHLDAHALWWNPDNGDHVILGNDGGLHVSWDRGETWLHLNNLPIGEFYAVGYDMDSPFNVYGGTQDNAALYGPVDRTPKVGEPDPWRHVYLDPWGGGDSYFTYRDPTDRNTMYYEHQFGVLRRKDMSTGKTVAIQPKAKKGQPPYRYNWMTPFFISPHDPRTLYYGAQHVLKSTDRGDTWTSVSPDLTTNPGPERQGNVPFGTLTTLSLSTLDPKLIYAGADDGNVQVTRDGGATWTLLSADLPDKWVSRVRSSRHAAGRVYVTMTGYRDDDFRPYVWASDDFGATWTSIAAGLPSESINVIDEDAKHPDHLYLGTDLGVYVSRDRGTTWHSLSATLPTTPVHDLFVHPRDPTLVIGTHGRSCWALDVSPIRQ